MPERNGMTRVTTCYVSVKIKFLAEVDIWTLEGIKFTVWPVKSWASVTLQIDVRRRQCQRRESEGHVVGNAEQNIRLFNLM